MRPLIELDGLRTIASLTFDGHGPSILPSTMLSTHLRANFRAVPIEGIAQRRVCLVRRRFGFPAAPVRAIHALLSTVVREASKVPHGVVIPESQSLCHSSAVSLRSAIAADIVARDPAFQDVGRGRSDRCPVVVPLPSPSDSPR